MALTQNQTLFQEIKALRNLISNENDLSGETARTWKWIGDLKSRRISAILDKADLKPLEDSDLEFIMDSGVREICRKSKIQRQQMLKNGTKSLSQNMIGDILLDNPSSELIGNVSAGPDSPAGDLVQVGIDIGVLRAIPLTIWNKIKGDYLLLHYC